MRQYVKKTQDKKDVHHSDSLSRRRTAEERREEIPVQFKARTEQNADISFDNMRIHYSPALSEKSVEGIRMQTPVVQRYSRTWLETGDTEEEALNFGKDEELYGKVEKDEKLDEFLDARLVKLLKKRGFEPNPGWRYASVKNNAGDMLRFWFFIEKEDSKRLWKSFPIWFKLPNYASGDQFTLAAMLAISPMYSVMINQSNIECSADGMLETIRRALDGKKKKVKVTVNRNTKTDKKETEEIMTDIITKDKKIRVFYKKEGIEFDAIKMICEQRGMSGPDKYTIKMPEEATKIVGKKYTQTGLGKNLRMRWGLPEEVENWEGETKAGDDAEKRIKNEWVAEKTKILNWISEASGINKSFGKVINELKQKNIVVLWLRHSGAAGGAHIEHDTGTKAMQELVDQLLTKESVIIILAGDKRVSDSSRRKKDKVSQVHKLMGKDSDRIFDFTEFWKNDSDLLKSWGGKDRINQIRLYDMLKAKAKSLRHIGSRSGNLELMALIGHQVNYIEEKNSYGGRRMEAFENSEQLHYKRLLVERPLTFKGNVVRIINYILNFPNINEEFNNIFKFPNMGKKEIKKKGMAMEDYTNQKEAKQKIVADLEHIGKIMYKTNPEYWPFIFWAVNKGNKYEKDAAKKLGQDLFNFYLYLVDMAAEVIKGNRIKAIIVEKAEDGAMTVKTKTIREYYKESDSNKYAALDYQNVINPMTLWVARELRERLPQEELRSRYRSLLPENAQAIDSYLSEIED